MTSSTSRARRKRERPAPPGFHFDEADAQRAVDFFAKRLRHVEGLWAGHPFLLEPWQHDIVWNVFGWKRDDGRRRYTTVYVEIPRKNGKSTFGAGLALKLLTADGEFGAQVYGAAEDRDQATIVFRIWRSSRSSGKPTWWSRSGTTSWSGRRAFGTRATTSRSCTWTARRPRSI